MSTASHRQSIPFKSPPKPRRAFLGVDSVQAIAPGETVAVVARPEVPFQANRFHVRDECAAFTIVDIRVGKNSQFTNPTPVPASAFTRKRAGALADEVYGVVPRLVLPAEPPVQIRANEAATRIDCDAQPIESDHMAEADGFGEPADFDRCRIGMGIYVIVRNDGSTPLPFRAVYFGEIPNDDASA